VREDSYVVRIYRRGRGKRSAMVGVVEAARTGWQKPFRSLQEMVDILAGTCDGSGARRPAGSADATVAGKREDPTR
jgi:hypothetical protein